NCGCVITISEAFTKPCILGVGITVPACDEDGSIVGKCSQCNKKFIADVTNPEFAEFKSGAIKIDSYFNVDGQSKEDSYRNFLKATSRVKGDEKLKQYYLNYTYDDYP